MTSIGHTSCERIESPEGSDEAAPGKATAVVPRVRRVQLKWEYNHDAVNSSEAVVNLIRVNSWNSWPVKPTTNFHEFHENDHCHLDTLVIGLRKLWTGAGARGSY